MIKIYKGLNFNTYTIKAFDGIGFLEYLKVRVYILSVCRVELNKSSEVLFLIIYVYWTVTVSFKTAVGMNDCSCNPDIQLVSSCSSSALGHVTAPVTLNSAHALSSFRTCCLAVAG